MLDDPLRPSAEAEPILRDAGWSPNRVVDTSHWVEVLRREGNEVFPFADAIMRNFGGLRFSGPRRKRHTRHDFEVNPDYWYDMREHLELVEEVVGSKVCPL